MSIPKEPRQLMINLMYLVLTAMLALNVSAEIMNAFKVIDDSLAATRETTDLAIDSQEKALNETLGKDGKQDFKGLGTGVAEIRAASAEFIKYVEDLKVELIDGSGNKNGELDEGDMLYPGTPKEIYKGKKDKDITTRLLVVEGKGDALRAKVEEARTRLVEAYRNTLSNETTAKAIGYRLPSGKIDQEKIDADVANFENSIVLRTETDEEWKAVAEDGKESWADYRFRQLPLISALPLLTKFQADAKNAEAFAVSELAKKVGGLEIVFDQFFPVIKPDKSYVVGGENINAEISVGSYSSSFDPSNIRITANGQPLRVGSDGKAAYTITGSGAGQKTVKLTASVTNPLTGEVTTGTSDFTYEVGSRSASVAADKMNVFYVGVPNPITVTAGGVSSNAVRVNGTGPIQVSGSYPNFTVTPTGTGSAKINVTANGKALTSADFRVKRIPTPVALLGVKGEGTMGNGEMAVQQALQAKLEDFEFDARCQIQGFKMTRVPQRQDPVTIVNQSGRFGSDAQRLARAAKPGDTYYFRDVKGRCPGDGAGRDLNSLVFTIR